MSHFTHMKTCFHNLFYLRKALNKLNISHKVVQTKCLSKSGIDATSLIISQSSNSNIEFFWSGQEYELLFDRSFWEQPYPIEDFVNKVTQKYAGEVILGEAPKTGFQPVKHQKNSDGSEIIVLERWNLLNMLD